MCAKLTACGARPSRGVWGRNVLKNTCPEIESGGLWQLADYPTLASYYNIIPL